MANEVFTVLRAMFKYFDDPAREGKSSKAIAAAGNYAANDVLSEDANAGLGQAWYVGGLARTPGRPFWLVGVRGRCSEDSVVFRLRIHAFRRKPNASSEMDDNAAFTLNDADRASNYIGIVCDLPAFTDRGDFSASKNPDIRELIVPDPNETGFWFIVETLDAETNETAGMNLAFDFLALPL